MPPDPDLIPAIGYIRVSMLREEQISPETQKAAIQDWARRRGRRVTDWIEDLDMTGREFLKRRIGEAIGRVRAGEAREIAVWKYSRFGRDRAGVAVNLDALEKAGGQLQSATEEVDARSATGRFTRGMLFEVAAFESDRAAETWAEAYSYRNARGLPPLGRPRFGYRRLGRIRSELDPLRTIPDRKDPQGERYVPDPELGPVLAGMYRAYNGGEGGHAIGRGLNERAIPNTYGNPWSGRTVLDVLDSGFGAGYLRVHDPACPGCGEKGKARCRRKVFIRGAHEPVIGEDEWQAYRARRKISGDIPPRHRAPAYPLSGLVRCWHCGAAMVTSGAKKEGVRFRCSQVRNYPGSAKCAGRPSVPLDRLLEAVRGALADLAAEVDAETAVAERRSAARTAREEAARLAGELADADRELTRLAYERVRGSALPPETWERLAEELTSKRHDLSQRLAAAEAEAQASSADPAPPLAGILDGWEILPAPVLNRLLRTVIRHVTVRCTAPAQRDELGHFMPQETEIEVIPLWAAHDT